MMEDQKEFDFMKEGMLGPTKKIEEAADDWENKTDELISALNKLDPSFDAATKKIKDLIRSIVEQIKLAKKEDKQDKKVLDVTSKLEKATRALSKKATATTASATAGAAATAAAGGGGKGKPPSKVASAFGDSFASFAKAFKKGNLTGIAVEVTNAWKPMNIMFAGLVKDEVEFMQQMREIAFVTQGITGDFQDQQEAFQYLGKTVRITGQNLSVFQKEYVKNLQRGVKTQKEMLSVTKTGLHVSTMVGDTSNEIADTLSTWHMKMGLTAADTAQLGMGIQAVARETGVMGSNLARAVKSTESIVKTMRNLGTLTATSAENIIRLAAASEKIGIADEMNELVTAASSFYKLVNDTNPKAKSLMYMIAASSGSMKMLYNNTLLTTREGINKFATGLDKVAKRFGLSMNMDPSEVSATANYAIQSATGKTFGELKLLWEASQSAGKSLAQRQKEINKELNAANTTAKEKLKLEQELKDLELKKGFEFSGAYQTAIKTAKDKGITDMAGISEIMMKSVSKNKEMMEDMKSSGISLTNAVDMAKGSQLFLAEKLTQAGGSDFSSQIKDAFASGDVLGQKEIYEKMIEEQQKMVMKKKGETDPITNLSLTLKDLNEYLRSAFGPALRGWLGVLAPLGAIAASLAQLFIYSLGAAQLITWMLGAQKAQVIWEIAKKKPHLFWEMGVRKLHTLWEMGVRKAQTLWEMGMGSKLFGKLGGLFNNGIGKLGGIFGKGKGLAKAGSIITAELVPEAGALAAGGAKAAGSTAAKVAGSAGTKVVGGMGLKGGLTALGQVASKVAWPITAIVGGLFAVTDALEAGKKANDIFGVSVEKVTMNQRMAAEGAGLLTGALNFLTFGLFSGALGPTGSLTKILAKLISYFPPFVWALQLVLIPLKVLWGVLKGLWAFIKNIFVAGLESWKIVLKAFSPLFDAVQEIFNAFSSAFAEFGVKGGSSISIVEALTWAIGGLGKLIGWVMKILATFAAAFITWWLTPLVKGIKSLAVALKPVFVWLAKAVSYVWDTVKGIIKPFEDLYNELVGHSIVPDLVKGIVGWFEWMVAPIKLVMNIIKIAAAHAAGVLKIFGEYLGGMWDVIAGIFTLDFSRISGGTTKMFKAVFLNLPKLFFKTFSKMFLELGKFFINRLKNIFIDYPKWWWDTLTGTMGGLLNFGKWLWGVIVGKLKSFGKWLWDNTIGGMAKLGTWIYDTFTTALQKAWDYFTGGVTKKEKETESAARVDKEGKSAVKGASRAASGALDVVTGGGEGRMAGARQAAKGASEAATSKAGRFALGPMWAAGVGITDLLGITNSGPKKEVPKVVEAPQKAASATEKSKPAEKLGAQKVPAFAEGATMITRGGLALIHSGEQINPARATASAAPVNDVYNRMRQEQVTQTGVVAKTPQIGKLETINQEQANLLDQINSGISTLVGLMKPSDIITSGPGVTAESRSQTTPARSTDYAKWQYGMQSSNPGVQRVNNGQ